MFVTPTCPSGVCTQDSRNVPSRATLEQPLCPESQRPGERRADGDSARGPVVLARDRGVEPLSAVKKLLMASTRPRQPSPAAARASSRRPGARARRESHPTSRQKPFGGKYKLKGSEVERAAAGRAVSWGYVVSDVGELEGHRGAASRSRGPPCPRLGGPEAPAPAGGPRAGVWLCRLTMN